MSQGPSPSSRRLRLTALFFLVAGLIAAVWVYIAAAGATAEASDYRIVGGQVYAAEDSPRELQQLERLGGKASVQTFRFNRWLASLWQGQHLAYTLGAIGIFLALLCLYIAALVDEPVAA